MNISSSTHSNNTPHDNEVDNHLNDGEDSLHHEDNGIEASELIDNEGDMAGEAVVTETDRNPSTAISTQNSVQRDPEVRRSSTPASWPTQGSLHLSSFHSYLFLTINIQT